MPIVAVVAPANVSSSASRTWAARRGYPTLTGNPSQIEFAETVRRRLVEGLNRAVRAGQGAIRTQKAQETREWLLSHTEAQWWIDNRNYQPSTIQQLRYKAVLEIYGSFFGTRRPGAARKANP